MRAPEAALSEGSARDASSSFASSAYAVLSRSFRWRRTLGGASAAASVPRAHDGAPRSRRCHTSAGIFPPASSLSSHTHDATAASNRPTVAAAADDDDDDDDDAALQRAAALLVLVVEGELLERLDVAGREEGDARQREPLAAAALARRVDDVAGAPGPERAQPGGKGEPEPERRAAQRIVS